MKIFYHNDKDGECAAAVVRNHYRHLSPQMILSPDDFIQMDYKNKFGFSTVKAGETVWIVDLSLDEQSATLVKTCLVDTGSEVIWIDHHITSIRTQETPGFEWLKLLPGIRCSHDTIKEDGTKVNFSGAALTYIYCTTLIHPEKLRQDILRSNDWDHDLLPDYIKYISDYDCWAFNYDPNTTFFKLGMDAINSDPSSSVWIHLDDDDDNGTYIRYALTTGQILKGYIDTNNAENLTDFGFETEIDGHRCLAINRTSNSWIFGDLYNRYPVCMTFCYDGERYKFSLFSSDSSIDVSEMAKSRGGGGHRAAAGFYLEENPFHRTGDVIKI